MLRSACWSGWTRRIVLLAMLGLVASPFQPASAQATPPPTVRITRIDSSGFPDVSVYLVADNLAGDLRSLTATLQQDSAPIVDVQDKGMVVAGVQVALVLDASTTILRPGMTGDPRHLETGKAARRLVQRGLLSAEHDWLTSIAFGTDKQIATLKSWSQDHQGVADSLYTYKPESIGVTPLYDLLFFALKLFDDSALPPGQERAIIVFSDGVDVVSTTGLVDAVKLAADKHVRIYPVMVGPETAQTRKNLEYLSTITGGQYFHLSSVENLDGLWDQIARARSQRVLSYRSSEARPRTATVTLHLPDGRQLSDTHEIPAVTLAPVEVAITAPPAGVRIERKSPTFEMPLEQVDPKALEVRLAFNWPDGRPRALRQLMVQVGGQTEVRTGSAINEPVIISIAALDSGPQTIQATAVDEVGLEGKAAPLPIQIAVIRPPAPTVTPDATLVAQAAGAATVAAQATEQIAIANATVVAQATTVVDITNQIDDLRILAQNLGLATIGSAAFGVIMLGFAIYVVSNKDRRRQATQIITGTIAAATEPFRPRGRGRGRNGRDGPRVQLVLVDDGGAPGMPPTIPLARTGLRLGRDPAVVDQPLNDRRISRLHCRIVEDGPSGGYRIFDEGSASGTYVNDDEVGHNGQPLNPDDIISIGPVTYRFEIVGVQPATVTEVAPKAFSMDDNTDPYLRTPPSNRT